MGSPCIQNLRINDVTHNWPLDVSAYGVLTSEGTWLVIPSSICNSKRKEQSVILMMRAWAVWGRSRVIAALLTALFLVSVLPKFFYLQGAVGRNKFLVVWHLGTFFHTESALLRDHWSVQKSLIKVLLILITTILNQSSMSQTWRAVYIIYTMMWYMCISSFC